MSSASSIGGTIVYRRYQCAEIANPTWLGSKPANDVPVER